MEDVKRHRRGHVHEKKRCPECSKLFWKKHKCNKPLTLPEPPEGVNVAEEMVKVSEPIIEKQPENLEPVKLEDSRHLDVNNDVHDEKKEEPVKDEFSHQENRLNDAPEKTSTTENVKPVKGVFAHLKSVLKRS